jgi:hypothetical protein
MAAKLALLGLAAAVGSAAAADYFDGLRSAQPFKHLSLTFVSPKHR